MLRSDCITASLREPQPHYKLSRPGTVQYANLYCGGESLDTVEKYQRYVITSCTKGVEPVVVDRGRGATLIDTEGRTYIDCFAGISVVNAGHCNEQINAAAKAQIDRLVHANVYSYYLHPRLTWRRSSRSSFPTRSKRPSSATAAPRPSRARSR